MRYRNRRRERPGRSRLKPVSDPRVGAVFAALGPFELIALIECIDARERGQIASAEHEAVYGAVRDRLVEIEGAAT